MNIDIVVVCALSISTDKSVSYLGGVDIVKNDVLIQIFTIYGGSC